MVRKVRVKRKPEDITKNVDTAAVEVVVDRRVKGYRKRIETLEEKVETLENLSGKFESIIQSMTNTLSLVASGVNSATTRTTVIELVNGLVSDLQTQLRAEGISPSSMLFNVTEVQRAEREAELNFGEDDDIIANVSEE